MAWPSKLFAMTRLNWERFRRQKLVWARGGQSKRLAKWSTDADDVSDGYVVRERDAHHIAQDQRVRTEVLDVPELLPTWGRRRHRLEDWVGALGTVADLVRGIEEGEALVIRQRRRQLVTGCFPGRFVAVGSWRTIRKADVRELHSRDFQPQPTRFLDGGWWVHEKDDIRDYSMQAHLLIGVMRDLWRLRLPDDIESAQPFGEAPFADVDDG